MSKIILKKFNVYLNYPLTYIGREMFNNINDKNMNSTLLK